MFIARGVIRGGMELLCRLRGLLLKLKQRCVTEMTRCVESLELIATNRNHRVAFLSFHGLVVIFLVAPLSQS